MLVIGNLIKYEIARLTKTGGFLLTVFTTVIAALWLTPNADARYSILKASGYIGAPNEIWIGIVVSMSSILIITILVFFLLDGSYRNNYSDPLFDLMRSTPISDVEYLFTRTITYFCLSIIFLAILITTILATKIGVIIKGEFKLIPFFLVIFYFSILGLLFFSIMLSLIEHFIFTRIWRIFSFVILLNLLLILSNRFRNTFLDFFGYSEVRSLIEIALRDKSIFKDPITLSFGILPYESAEKIFFLNSIQLSYFFWAKLTTILILQPIILFLGSFKFNKFLIKKSSAFVSKTSSIIDNRLPFTFEEFSFVFSKHNSTSFSQSIFNLILCELKNIPIFLNRASIFILFIISIVSFFLDKGIMFHYLIPIVLLILLPLFTKFLVHQDELAIDSLIVTTPLGYKIALLTRILLVYCIIIITSSSLILLIYPYENRIKFLFYLFVVILLISTISIASIKFLKSTKLFEILFIIVNLILIWAKYSISL